VDTLYNLNIERAVLSAIIFEPEIFEDIEPKLEPQDFYLPFHQHIFIAIDELSKEEKPIDEEFLRIRLTNKKEFDEVAMLNLLSANPISNYNAYVNDIKEWRRKRDLENLSFSIRKRLNDNQSSEEIQFSIMKDIEENNRDNYSIKKTAIDEIDIEEPEFYIKDWLPIPKKTLTIINAHGGTGKTWTALQIALRFSKENPNKKVFLWLSEDPLGVVKDRLIAIKDKILVGEYKSDNIDISNDFPQQMIELNGNSAKVSPNFYRLKRELREYDLIILDPLLAFYGGDENNNSQARIFMQQFLNWSSEEEKSIIYLHHSKKNSSENSSTTARGAGAFIDACRCCYDLSKYYIHRDGKKIADPNKRGLVKFLLSKDNYGAGKYLDSYLFSRKITPASTEIIVTYIDNEIVYDSNHKRVLG